MIVLGALLALSGAIVLYFARKRGHLWMRRIGLIVLVAGLIISAAGAIRIAVESM